MLRGALLVLAGMAVGCVAAVAVGSVRAEAFDPNPEAPQWQQFCEQPIGRFRAESVNPRLAAAGREGWELVEAEAVDTGILYCFRRPAPR